MSGASRAPGVARVCPALQKCRVRMRRYCVRMRRYTAYLSAGSPFLDLYANGLSLPRAGETMLSGDLVRTARTEVYCW